MLKSVLATLSLGLIGMPAIADEIWSTPIGDVYYDHDTDDDWAVLSYPGANDVRGLAYLKNLAGIYKGRGAYAGIWIEPDSPDTEKCNVAISDPETGEPRYTWGQVELVFTEPDFPSGWVAIRGDCFNPPSNYLIGKPVVTSE